MSRKSLALLALLVLLALAITGWARAEDLAPDLDVDKIKAILQTNSEQEQGFVENAVKLVKNGTLPRDIFDSTFLWAKRKSRLKFYYFKFALTKRAAEVGIEL